MSTNPVVEYLTTSRIGEKGQVTVPKPYRDEIGLSVGAPIAVVRIGDGLILLPEIPRFERLCRDIARTLAGAGISAEQLQETLPEARELVVREYYPELLEKPRRAKRPRKASPKRG